MPLHEGFGKGLGTFELRGRTRGTENAQAVSTKLSDHASGQGGFGAHHRQANALGLRPFAQRTHIGDGNVLQILVTRSAAVSGGHIHGLYLGRLRQLPGQGMLAAAAADDQHFHRAAL